MLWNPPLRQTANKPAIKSSNALDNENSSVELNEKGKHGCNHIVESCCFDSTIGLSDLKHEEVTAAYEFVEGCADRPETLGISQSNSTDRANNVVQYVGGWKRRNRQRPTSAVKDATEHDVDITRKKRKQNRKSENPQDSVVNHDDTVVRESTIFEASQLFATLIKNNLKTLAFCKVRKLVELVLKYTVQDLEQTAPHLKDLVASYRGGYTMKERRNIEADLFSGKLIGVTSTCALELGIDLVRYYFILP